MLLWPRTELNVDASEGANVVAFYELNYLNKYGIDTKLFVKSVNREYPNIKTIRHIEFLESKDYFYYIHFILRNINSDLFVGINCPKLALFMPRKTIISFHINKPWLPNYDIKIFRDRYKKSFFVFCSKFIKDYFLERYPEIQKDRCFVCYNGVDILKFAPQPKKRDNEKVRILFLGQWIEEKGIYVLLEAIKLLEKKRDDFQVILGGGPYLWKIKDLHLRQQENEKKVYDIIRNLNCVEVTGEVSSDKLPDIYNSADIVVVPSIDQEALALVNIEAMACGLPVIASKIGGMPEAIIDNKTGILVEPNNANALADAIEFLIDNESIRKRMGKSGRKRVEKYFTWDIHTKKLIDIFNYVINH